MWTRRGHTFLAPTKISAAGWDPNHAAKNKLIKSDVVNLGYVLNVIENSHERTETLRRAFALTRELLIVSVRVDQSVGAALEFNDGVITTRGTFQKIYTQAEFREYVESALRARVQRLESIG
jgi:DNA phosphorothioation-associated putative methyltransferase